MDKYIKVSDIKELTQKDSVKAEILKLIDNKDLKVYEMED